MRKKILIISIIFLIAAVGLVIIFYLVGEKSTGVSTGLVRCENLQENKRDECWAEVAIEKVNSEICANIKNLKIRDECYFRVASRNSNSLLCDKIKEKDGLLRCRALTLRDAKFCKAISDIREKNRCYIELSLRLDTPALCSKISDSNIMILCKAATLKDPDLCKNLEEGPREYCYSFIAEILRDSSICDKINDESKKEQCKLRISK
ncbi:hypothetical protein J7K42_03045 [bacterium]|nr:hypothetical protein [bacterium]